MLGKSVAGVEQEPVCQPSDSIARHFTAFLGEIFSRGCGVRGAVVLTPRVSVASLERQPSRG